MLVLSSLLTILVFALPSLSQSSLLLISMIISSLVLAAVLAINATFLQPIGESLNVLGNSFSISSLNLFVGTFFFIVSLMIFISFPKIKNLSLDNNYVSHYVRPLIVTYKDYLLVGLFSSIGSLLLLGVNNLIIMYLAIELQSFGLYILSAMNKKSEASTGAGLKYFLLGSLASCFILLGLVLIYSETGLIYLNELYALYSVSFADFNYLNYGIGLVVLGLLFKLAASPLHYWAPDVYNDSPTSITVWLTIMPKIALFTLLYNFTSGFESINIMYSIDIKNIILISSGLSLIIGSILGLSQTKIKKLLAYSTISHVGFLLLILVINNQESTSGFLFYIVQYSLTNLLIFLILLYAAYTKPFSKNLSTGLENNDLYYIIELRGMLTSNYWLGLSFIIALFSMTGIPPLPGFFAKQVVILSAAEYEYYFLAFLCIFVSVISATYYLKLITTLYSNTEKNLESIYFQNTEKFNKFNVLNATSIHTYIISTLTILIIGFVFNNSLILNITQLVSLSLYG